MADTPVSLLERLRGNPAPDDWAEFVAIYSEPLFRYALSRRLPADDAQDLVQNIFAVLVEHLPRFDYDPGRSFTAWLMTIARNKANDFWKEKGRRPPHLPLDQHGPAVEDDSMAEREFAALAVHAAFARLQAEFDPRTVTACRECWLNGRPVAEVAVELELSANAVQLRLTRARKRLAALLRGMVE